MNLKQLFHTVRHLKPIQIIHQVKYRLVKVKLLRAYLESGRPAAISSSPLSFTRIESVLPGWDGQNTFEFLNLSVDFAEEVDWNYARHGKLWNYNLQYANYLLQGDIGDQAKVALLRSLYQALWNGDLVLEPYPASLRLINMMRWLSGVDDPALRSTFDQYLYAELTFLNGRLEYHILGNHLLENAFALMMGGAYFDRIEWKNTAQNLLRRELTEQVLEDGAHFELSPMYHQIILFRLLELVDWYQSYDSCDETFLSFCRERASLMVGWLDQISFSNGDIPLFNDAARGIAYETSFLLDYAGRLGIDTSRRIAFGVSGYRSFANMVYEIKMDLAQIGPSYQPGHAHADALSFILYQGGRPLFVEQGTSTYQLSARRDLERSTEAHNTVVVNGKNQSDVWGGFRVGKRARTTIHAERDGIYEASHNGYRGDGVIHTRKFICGERSLEVIDSISGTGEAVCYLHLHPSRELKQLSANTFMIDETISVEFGGARQVEIETYDYADTYNQYTKAKRFCVTFANRLNTRIHFEEA